jgi:hypothetical protein
MMLFGSNEPPEHHLSDERIAAALSEIKQGARDRRIAMVAPLVLAAAVLTAFVAAPPQHGGLTLVPEADASDEALLPRVFGANGVWRLAEPIGDPQPSVPGPPWMVEFPSEPDSPDFVLVSPDEPPEALPNEGDFSDHSLPASASSPPTPTLGQSGDDIDWSNFRVEVRVDPVPEPDTESETALPAASVPAVADNPPTSSSGETADEDVTDESQPSPDASTSEPAGDGAAVALGVTSESVAGPADIGDSSEANPSMPQLDQADAEAQPLSAVATIVSQSVLVHRAHVSVTVLVVDDDSSVIDWCNTRVDWGDGSVTGLTDPGGDASCTASCERQADPSEAGVDESITFTHDYSVVIDAAPRIYVATGDGCSYTLAEFQLNPFTVVPY